MKAPKKFIEFPEMEVDDHLQKSVVFNIQIHHGIKMEALNSQTWRLAQCSRLIAQFALIDSQTYKKPITYHTQYTFNIQNSDCERYIKNGFHSCHYFCALAAVLYQ